MPKRKVKKNPHSNCETQLTREIREGRKQPRRNMTNRVAIERPTRRAAWLESQGIEE